MLVDELKDQCERDLKQPYTIRTRHYIDASKGWTWDVEISIDDGSIVHATHASIGAAVRAASNALRMWVSTFKP